MQPAPPRPAPARGSIPWQVLTLSLLLTLLATYYLWVTAEHRERLRFENQAERAERLLGDRMEVYVALLQAVSGLFAVQEPVHADAFRTFVSKLDLQRRYPGLQGIGFSRRAAPGEVGGLIESMRGQGVADFRIWPDPPRPEIHAILYIEPLDRRNRAALGYDMFTDPARRAAMVRARDTGAPALSERVILVQEIDAKKQPGFLLYVPVYRRGLPLGTQRERRFALLGYVYSPFRAGDFLGGILGPEQRQGIDFAVHAGEEPLRENLLFRSGAPERSRFTRTSTFEVGGTHWTLVSSSLPSFEQTAGRRQTWVVLLAGLLISAILFALSRSQVQARMAAEQAAAGLARSEEALRASGERYRQLVELSPEPIFVQRDGRFSFVNTALVRLLGLDGPGEILGRPVLDFIHPASRQQAARTGSLSVPPPHLLNASPVPEEGVLPPIAPGVLVEERWINRAGFTVDVEAAATTFLDQQAPVTQVLLRDISGRKSVERRLREEAGITETLYSIGLAAAAELDLRSLAQTIVDATTRITGAQFGAFFYHLIDDRGGFFREHSLAGTPPPGIEEFLAPRDPALPGPTFRGEGVVRIDDVLEDSRIGRRPPSPERWIGGLAVRSYLTAPIVSRSGELLGGLFFGHPEPGVFTRRVERILGGIAAQAAVAIDNARLYERERRARAEAETANQAKDRFMASLSHELRTPLTPVLAVIATLEREGSLAPGIAGPLATIRRNVELEARLIDDLLDLTRITRGKLELKPEVADLREVLSHALETCCPPGTNGRERFVIDLPAEEDLRLWGDAPRLTQVFWNLMTNALKFTPDGGPIRIRVRRDEAAGALAAAVSDQGIGIEPQRLPHVFDAFEQGQRSITRQYGGLGLGLAITKAIVELHGGQIEAESEGPGQGATFHLRLPVGAAHLPARGAEPRPPRSAPAEDESAERALHILLVEDHPDTADAMRTLLSVVGHRVTVANSAREALAAAEAVAAGAGGGRIDLVISDVGLPDVSGLELMPELRSRYHLRGIALSGYGMDEDVRRSHEAGFERHLTKPVSLQLLQEAIREVGGTADRGGARHGA
jgi:signal transduction histidine kinase/CHASE1-domain containing sensor protein/ActR/RegA family two-component response regulator